MEIINPFITMGKLYVWNSSPFQTIFFGNSMVVNPVEKIEKDSTINISSSDEIVDSN